MWCFERLTSFIFTFICRPMYLIQNQLCNCEIENSFVSVFLFSLSKQLCLFKEAGFIWKQSSVTLQLADISLALPLCFPWHFLKYLLHTDLTRFELIDVVMCFKRPAPLTVIFAVQAVPFSLVSCLLCGTVMAAIHWVALVPGINTFWPPVCLCACNSVCSWSCAVKQCTCLPLTTVSLLYHQVTV